METVRIALIPAFEPDAHLPEVASRLQGSGFSVVMVNDGSDPSFDPVFQEAGRFGKVLGYTPNKGKGYALKTGLAYIQETYNGAYTVVTLDADGQHKAEDVARVCKQAEEKKGTLVLGSRMIQKNTPPRSRMGNTITRFVFRLSTGKWVYDTQTGLRAFTSDMIPFMCSVEGDRYEYEMNVLLLCTQTNVPITEVQIETVYINGNSGSHFHTVRDSVRIYKDILRFAASSLTGFVLDYLLYTLLVIVTAPWGDALSVPLSNVLARVVSASVNFTLNKKLVFKNHDSLLKTAVLYFVLAACILVGNTLLLSFLVEYLGWNKYLAKIVTEIMFFVLSWLAQKFIVFRKKGPEGT